MKWDDSVKYADGKRVRRAGFLIAGTSLVLTDYNNRRLVLRDLTDEQLAEATPTTRGRHWLVQISTPGHKYGHTVVDTKDEAINIMVNRREEYQGRKMGK